MHQQEHQMSPHTLRATTCQIPSPTEDPQHTNITVNPYSSSQALLMDRNNCCDTNNLHEYNSGLHEYNYASVVNEMGDPSTPFVMRNHLQSPARLQQQRHPTLISNPLNSHHSLVSPQLARLTRTLRHPNNVNSIYGGSTSSACTASPNKTVLSSLSSTSCSPRSDMTRYQNTASIFSNSTEMSDLNGSSLEIYQDRNPDDTLPLGTTIYDSSYGDSSSNQHVYCEIPPVPPPPPAPSNRKPNYQMNYAGGEEELQFSSNQGAFRSHELPRNGEAFHGDVFHKQERKDVFNNSNLLQQSLTPYEEEFIKQNKASSSSSKLNGSPARRSCQSNNQVNSFSPTKSPRRFVSVENNATKFTNNVIMEDSTRSPKKKNRLTTQKCSNLGGRQFSDDNTKTKHESQV